MNPITITIQPPITERCSNCDYEASRSFGSSLVKCPKCGEQKVSSAYPKTTSVYVVRNKGSYDYAHPNEKQFNYTFQNLPKELKKSYTVDEEIDTDCSLECATELKTIIDRYLINNDKPEIEKVVKYLESVDEEQDELRLKEKQEKLERELYKTLQKRGIK